MKQQIMRLAYRTLYVGGGLQDVPAILVQRSGTLHMPEMLSNRKIKLVLLGPTDKGMPTLQKHPPHPNLLAFTITKEHVHRGPTTRSA